MKVCFISTSWVREKEILESLNKKVDLLFVMPYKPNGNYSISDVSSFCKKNKIKFIIDNSGNNRARSLYRLKKDFLLIKRIKEFNADIVYIETFGSPYFALLSRLFLGKQKTIIAIMDYKLHQRSKGSFKFSEKFYRFVQLRFFKYYQFFSYTQNNIFKMEYPNKESFAIRLFLVDKDLHRLTKSSPKNRVNFLFFGRIFYYKGVDVLIKATNILAKKIDNFKVTIAGSCDEWVREYQPLIDNLDFFDLKIRFIDKQELPDLFSKSDYFVAPYRKVTQSGPLLRAYNYDIIPIVSNEDGFTEYVSHKQTGFVFDNEDEFALAKIMENVIKLNIDERSKIINNIQAFKEDEFDINRVTNQYIEMFDKVLK